MSEVIAGRLAAVRVGPAGVRRWAPGLVLLFAFVALSFVVVPRVEATGTAVVSTYDLNASQVTPGLKLRGLTRNVYGFVVRGFGAGKATFTPAVPPVRPGEKSALAISAGSPTAPTQVTLIDGAGVHHVLGTARGWRDRHVDISGLSLGPGTRIQFAATSFTASPQLVGDRVVVVTYPPSALPRAGRWEVAAWVGLAVLLVLALLRRVHRYLALVPLTALAAFLVWPSVRSSALVPLATNTWTHATRAAWLDLDHGLLSGTFGPAPSLTVQLFHALSPITGDGATGARTASMLIGILAIAAIYGLGQRLAGAVGAVAAATLALLSDPFRQSLSGGDSTGTLVLVMCLFLLAAHRVLVRRDTRSLAILAAVGAVAVLAAPTWWPGIVAALVLLALRYGPVGDRRRALAVALGVLVLVSLPARVSVAHQSDGDLTADITLRTTYARNAEFVGRDHGAPPNLAALQNAPYAGEQVGLGSYVFGDHTLSVVAGGTLSGAYDGLAAAGARPETRVVGLIAFMLELAGTVFLLFVPRVRLFVVIPAMIALVPWFLADRTGKPPFVAGAAFWPALVVGGASLVYAAWQVAEPRLRRSAAASALRGRAEPLLARRRRVPHAS